LGVEGSTQDECGLEWCGSGVGNGKEEYQEEAYGGVVHFGDYST